MKKLFLMIFSIALLFVSSSCYASTDDETAIYNKKMDKIEVLSNHKKYKQALREANKLLKTTTIDEHKKALTKEISLIAAKKERQDLLVRFYMRYDKYEKSTWYDPVNFIFITRPLKTTILQTDEGILLFKLHFVAYYKGSSWMFVDKINLYSDGNTREYYPSVGARNVSCHNVDYCDYEENLWFNLNDEELNIFEKMVNGNSVSMRASGNHEYKDFNISNANKKDINECIKVYRLLKSKEINQSNFLYHPY